MVVQEVLSQNMRDHTPWRVIPVSPTRPMKLERNGEKRD